MKRALTLFFFLLAPANLSGAIVVQGNATTTPYAFKTAITTKAYDRLTGTFYVGLASGSDAFTLSKASRPTFTSVPSFLSVLSTNPASSLTNATIAFLSFSAQQNAGLDVLLAVPQNATTAITALFTNGTFEITSGALNDATGTSATSGIVQMTTNSNLIFAAVAPSSSTFGNVGSGIALVGIGATNTGIVLSIQNATTGVEGNKAVPLDDTSTLLKGTSGGDNVVFNNVHLSMYWDDPMQRLFTGITLESGTSGTDIAKSVVVGQLNSGVLNLQAIAPDSAISGGGIDEIVVTQGTSTTLSPAIVKVMHASTGPDYLITTCAENSVCNRVFALPLVNDTSNPTSSLNGTLAKKDSTLSSSYKFVVPATSAGDLAENNPTTDPAAVIGAGNLPIQASDSVADMVVVDDGVYIALSNAPSSANDTGIWYSQALFGNDGKIIRWTPWAKRIVPLNAFPGVTLPGGATANGSINFLEVDAATGNIWLVEGTTGQTVGVTSWITGQSANDLLTRAGAFLSTGCNSILDLDQATRGFLGTTAQRYALFGGTNKVVFARTSSATNLGDPSSPQTAINDYSQVENLFSTLLPSNAGYCQVLEYSRTSTTADNDPTRTNYCFFFAGTQNGLFVFSASDGSGFNPITMSTLNLTPFSTGAWYPMAKITGSVIDIKTSGAGDTLYVITSETSPLEPMISTLYSIPFTNNTNTMFASSNINTIGRTRTGIFANVVQFYGVQIIATDNPQSAHPEDKEQLILATSQGLFTSNASQVGSASVATVTTQSAANWQLLASGSSTTATTAFYGIAQADTPIRQTTWPFSIENQSSFMTFNRGSLHQVSGNGDSAGTTAEFNSFYLPLLFNANPTIPSFNTLFPIISFFSDGGRRFFIYNRTADPATQVKIGVLPFSVTPWNITQPTILINPTLAQIGRFYWINQIGATGILMAGTGSGLVGLQ